MTQQATATVKLLEGLERLVSVTVPKDKVEKTYNEKLQKFLKNAHIKGFRPGKAPKDLIENRFKRDILSEVASELVESSLIEVFREHHLQPATAPQVKPEELKKDSSFQYDATFEVMPVIELKELNGLMITKLQAEVADQDIERQLQHLQSDRGEWGEVSRPAQLDDRITVTCSVFIDGQPAQGMQQHETVSWELKAGVLLPDLFEGLKGISANDEKEIHVKFPDQHQDKSLAGKNSLFKIKVQKVEEKKLPEINDAFAEKLGVKEGMTALRNEVKKNLDSQLKQAIQQNIRNELLKKLLELNPILVPKVMVEKEIDHLQQQRRQMFAQYTQSQAPLKWELQREPFVAEAERRVRLGLLFNEFIKVHQIKLDENKVYEQIRAIAATYRNPDKIMEMYAHDEALRSDVQSTVLENQVIEELISQVNFETKSTNFEGVMHAGHDHAADDHDHHH